MAKDIPKFQRRDLSEADNESDSEAEIPNISSSQFILMLLFAAFIDTLQFLTSFLVFTGPILAFVGWFVLAVWFMMLGLTSSTRFFIRSSATAAVSFLAEFFSVGVLPTITIGVVITYAISKGEKTLRNAMGDK